jgi:hypothetical protein
MASYITALEEVLPQQSHQEFLPHHSDLADAITRWPSARFAYDVSAMAETYEVPSYSEHFSCDLAATRSDHRRKTISTCMLAQAFCELAVPAEVPQSEEAMEGIPVKVRTSSRRRTWHDEKTTATTVGSEAGMQPSPQRHQPMKIHLSTQEQHEGSCSWEAAKVNDLSAGQEAVSTPGIARSRSGSNLLAPPGLTPSGLPSHGSVLHGSGNCRPCAWFWKPGGCQNGKECGHCHLCPEGEIKNRKKGKLSMMRLGMSTPKNEGCTSFGLSSGYSLADNLLAQEYIGAEPYGKQAAFVHAEQESTTCSMSDNLSCGSKSDLFTASPSNCAGNASTSGSDDEDAKLPSGPPPGFQAYASQGSIDHDRGNCKPCAWFWKPSGCQNGNDCNYCHVCSKGELKARKKTKQATMRTSPIGPETWKQEVIPFNLASLI